MKLNIVYGRAGSGKTTYIFKKIKELIKEKNKIYIITPEQFSFTAEKKLLEELEEKASLNAEVLTFSRMAYRVINEVGNNLNAIQSFGKSMLIYNILDDSKKELELLGKNLENVEVIGRSITEFKKHNITKEKLKEIEESIEDRYLKEKLHEMELVYSKFEENIEGKFLDEDDSLTYLANNIKNTTIFNDSIIFIDEFAGFTPQEYRVIEELLKCSKDLYVTICADNLDLDKNLDTDIFYTNKVTASRILKIAEANNIEIAKPVFLNKSYRFKSDELLHLEQNIYANIYKRFDKENKAIKLFLASNPYSEVEYVANKIIENVRDNGYRFKEIGIITKNIDTYSGLIKGIFSKYKIPVYIDEKKDLSQNILIKYIISLLDVFAKNWSYESVISYVKTKFCGISDEEIYKLENFCKKWGIKYSKWYKEEWNFGEDEKTIKEMNKIREKVISPLVAFNRECYKNMTGEELSKAIYNFLIQNEIDKKLQEKAKNLEKQNPDLASEYEASFNVVIKILDEIAKIFKDENLTFEKYVSFLKISFSENELGKLPAGFDEVTARRY